MPQRDPIPSTAYVRGAAAAASVNAAPRRLPHTYTQTLTGGQTLKNYLTHLHCLKHQNFLLRRKYDCRSRYHHVRKPKTAWPKALVAL